MSATLIRLLAVAGLVLCLTATPALASAWTGNTDLLALANGSLVGEDVPLPDDDPPDSDPDPSEDPGEPPVGE